MPGKAEVYTLEEAARRLAPQFTEAAKALDALPPEACPGDFGVARLTMNPSYIARSFFPVAMLRSVGLESVGSRSVRVTPDGWTKKGEPDECTTTELFVAGKRQTFRHLRSWTREIKPGSAEATDLAHIERFAAFTPEERIVDELGMKDRFFEVGVHLLPDEDRSLVQRGFVKFAKSVEVKLHTELGFTAGNMWFVAAEGRRDSIGRLAAFVFVRVIRPMPKLRGMRPIHRSTGVSISCNLPTEQPLSAEPKVAILDGGLPKDHVIGPWLRSYRVLDKDAHDDPDGPEHGLGVTSAFHRPDSAE